MRRGVDIKKLAVLAVLGLIAAAAVVGSLAFLDRNSAGLLKPGDARVVAKGEAVYVRNCASCHGRNLEGQADWQTPDREGYMPASPHDESGHTWHHSDELLFDITKHGVVEAADLKNYKTRMPAFGGVLTDEDILAALSFIKSTWPRELREMHDELNRVYAERGGRSIVRSG